MTDDSRPQDFQHRLETAVRSILSPVANGRSENQDNYLLVDAHGLARFLQDQQEQVQQLPNWPLGHIRLAVLDGMGGHSFGRQAAERSVGGLLAIPAVTELAAFSAQLEDLHRRLHAEMHQGRAEPGCTLTVVEIPPSSPALLFHVSDSRLYRINEDAADCLTVDHVPATKSAIHGRLSEAQWFEQVHQQNGFQVSQAFILGNTMSADALRLDAALYELTDANLPTYLQGKGDRRLLNLQPGQVYLLASDGLWHLPQPQDFIRRWPTILARADKPLKTLLDDLFVELILASAEQTTQGDNCTAIAFRLPTTP